MTLDPPRLRDPASAASDSLRELLRTTSLDEPSPEQLRRLAARLEPQLAAPPPAATKTVGLKTLASVTALVGLLVGIGLWLARDDASPTTAQRSARVEIAPTVPTPASPVASTVPPAAPAPAVPSTAAPEVIAPPASNTAPPERRSRPRVEASRPRVEVSSPAHDATDAVAEDELAILGRAQRALVGNDASAALSHAQRHAEMFPSGMMVEEREAIAIEALARLDRLADARVRFERFQASYPRSSYRQRLERLITATR